MTVYDVGEPVVLTGLFYSDAAHTTLADPTTVVLTIRDPLGVVITPAVVHAGLGTYTYQWTPAVRGMHEIHWVGTGAVAAVEQYGVNVRGGFPSASDLVDVQTVRAFMRMPKTEDEQDPVLEALITTASAHIIDAYQHEFAPAASVATTRSCSYRGNGIIDLAPWNAQAGTITAVTIDGDTTSPTTLTVATDYQASPELSQWGVVNYLRAPTLFPYPRFIAIDPGHQAYRRVDVTAKWGYPSVPQPVMMAACWTVVHWHRKYVGSRPSGFEPLDEASGAEVAIPQMARWLLRGFENRSIFA